ncbi:flavin-containing monooxygenase [Sphingorhabdus sp.]|jgi:cation diffusion facilitator CzcD-associated flavoprotein CzcO|uniref:flavin-containing monooxygenase n=1 Tax=Sphingorhabdus sp. TaxID=1902408 RepID=UPI0040474EB9
MAKKLRFIIIGAGMAGMLAGIRLKERGDHDFTIYEKGDSVGGTWRENHYPGLACDTPAHSYTYSFATNPEWSAFYAPGPEIRAYFEGVADRYDLKSQIEFNNEIAACRFVDGRWRVTTTDGREDVADVVIAATGVLHHPNVPDISGLKDFQGPVFHSARWDHAVPLDAKRVGVIGNGSTGVQIVSAVSKVAGKLTHFLRSPQWIMPCPDIKYAEEDKTAFRDDPAKIEEVRNGPDAAARRARFTAAIIDMDSPELEEIQTICERNLEESIRDPALREKLRPDYRAACKRMVFSAHYYDAVQRPNVDVALGAIDCVEVNGIRMKDGSFHELDVIALATGFKVDQFVRPMVIEGQEGQSLEGLWQEHPRAYYAVTVPGFPNFFLLNGPTGPVGNFTLIDIAEAQWDYADQLIDLIRKGDCDAIAPSMAALEDYEARRTEAAKRTVFASGCSSWYLDKDGVPQVWPWSYDYFRAVMAKPDLGDYEMMQGQ